MRIAQIVLPGATAFERKLQRIDRAALSASHDVTVVSLDELAQSGAAIAHVYASGELPPAAFTRISIPYVATAPLPQSKWSLRRPVAPRAVLSPLGGDPVPEAVEDFWFESRRVPVARDVKIVGSFARDGIRSMIDKTLHRIGRFRSDVTWHLYEKDPTPDDLAGVDAWVDPTTSESDFSGFVAEAQVFGLPVIASRTAINARRLENGRTGMLVPAGDANEMTHAILAALFKVEVAESRQLAAKQTASKYRARQRLRILTRVYEQHTS
ncbi:MAG TPA: glycosyltransferase [Thermoanaerobaculia bacterium]|nr:glycosyltransferase [Thermoanaerobaculia bacterium]